MLAVPSRNVAVSYILYFSTSNIMLTSFYDIQVAFARLVNVSWPHFDGMFKMLQPQSRKSTYLVCVTDVSPCSDIKSIFLSFCYHFLSGTVLSLNRFSP